MQMQRYYPAFIACLAPVCLQQEKMIEKRVVAGCRDRQDSPLKRRRYGGSSSQHGLTANEHLLIARRVCSSTIRGAALLV